MKSFLLHSLAWQMFLPQTSPGTDTQLSKLFPLCFSSHRFIRAVKTHPISEGNSEKNSWQGSAKYHLYRKLHQNLGVFLEESKAPGVVFSSRAISASRPPCYLASLRYFGFITYSVRCVVPKKCSMTPHREVQRILHPRLCLNHADGATEVFVVLQIIGIGQA